VFYKADYNIDLPVYAEDRSGLPILAVKESPFEESDPRGFTDCIVIRNPINHIEKASTSKLGVTNIRNDMLCGLAMTLLSIRENDEVENRDDISLLNTLVRIKNSLTSRWEILMPVRPYDNVITKHGDSFRKNFFIALDAFIRDAKEAIDIPSVPLASKLWRKHLGTRFPLVEEKECSRFRISERYSLQR
jgi:hypothetical protein